MIDATFVEQGIAQFEYTKPNGQKIQVQTLERLENPDIIIKYSDEPSPEPESQSVDTVTRTPAEDKPSRSSTASLWPTSGRN